MKLYMMVTQDKYELPMIVCDSLKELEKFSGYKKKTISQLMSHHKKHGINCRFRRIEVDDDD